MRLTLVLRMTVVTLTVLGCGCRDSQPPAPGRRLEASSLPVIKVTAKAKMLFTFATEAGGFETVDTLDKVVAARRGWVRVVDLAQKPEQRVDQELVYVADLRQAQQDNTYPYVVMSRPAFETAAANRARAGAAEPAAPARPAVPAVPAKPGEKRPVVLYATSWCPACRSARSYLQQKGIPFVEKDIEKDPAAADELLQKAKSAGISTSGVPVLDVNGTLMQGFDPDRLTELLGARS